jgi:hypothetical protein
MKFKEMVSSVPETIAEENEGSQIEEEEQLYTTRMSILQSNREMSEGDENSSGQD